MKISACTYVRNGLHYMYPFLESIQSVLPIVDEYVVVIGDSTDGTREAVMNLNSDKIVIVDTVWDLKLRTGGKLFAQQSNIALDNTTGDWILPIQADELIHEDDIQRLREHILRYDKDEDVQGLLFPFLNFWGNYFHLQTGRRVHRYEIRALRRDPLIRAYKDSQGFRKFSSLENYKQGEKGEKLNVAKIDIPVYHYFKTRPPRKMKEKSIFFASFYHNDEELSKHVHQGEEFDYHKVDRVEPFQGSHPRIMGPVIEANNWDFRYDRRKRKIPFRYIFLNTIERLTGWRIGEYKNYRVIKKS